MAGRGTTHAERIEMVQRHLNGESLPHIAHALRLNRYTVRAWWRAYQAGGWDALRPQAAGPHAVGPLGHFHPLVKYVALRLKWEHPGWGPNVLRLHLRRRASLQGLALPHNTALWHYLHQFGTRLFAPRHLRTHRPRPTPSVVRAPHEEWQMDLKGDERLVLNQAAVIAWGLTDTASGAPLAREVYGVRAVGNRAGLTPRVIQGYLRAAFTRWGLPAALRMDRDPLFVGSARLEWPSLLVLWLVGLGIQPLINRAFRPTDNTLIERANRTWCSDVTTRTRYPNQEALEALSAQMLEDRRTQLPSRHRGCQQRPPVEAFPTLLQPRRVYQPEQERALFDLGRVDDYLAHWDWRRRVDRFGQISLADHNWQVGRAYAGLAITVRFDAAPRVFVVRAVDGTELRRLTLPQVSQEYILGEGVCNR